MKKKTNVCIACLLAVGMTLNAYLPQLAGAKATASSAQTKTVVSVADGTSFEKPEYEFSGMSGYNAADVAEVIDKVQNYWVTNKYTSGWDWLTATYHLGALEAYQATGNIEYYNRTYDLAENYGWLVYNGDKSTVCDAICTAQVYCMLHSLTAEEDGSMDYKLEDAIDIFDYNYEYGMMDYSWVDEIYMAGFSLTYLSQVTGDDKYTKLDYDTYMYYRERFFDEESWLWFRDWQFVPETGSGWANLDGAEKVLWSRGNTWVYVTLAQRMLYMDRNDPAYETYKNDFLMMSEGLKNVRREDGIWNVNLGDASHKAGKEMTGTAGFLYGMCVGIDLGLLDADTYVPVVQKAYDTITTECIQESGLVGYCQPPAGSPSSYTTEEKLKNNTVSYGVGLTLMGLSRFMRLCSDYQAPTLTHESKAFDEDNAKLVVLDDDWYKGPMIVSTDSTIKAYTAYPYNGIENVVNGNWKSENSGASFRCYGLKSNDITVYVDFAETVTLEKIAMILNASYAYNYTIELSADGGDTWTTAAQTTDTTKVYKKQWTFEPTACNKARITFKYTTTDLLWVREILFYESEL